MKKYFCDVCGDEIAGQPAFAPGLGNKAVEVCGLEDLCPRCDKLSLKLDVPALVLAELRRLAGEKAEQPTPPPTPTPVLKGKAVREKKTILAAVEAFRKEHGPGAIAAIAKRARVDEGTVRDMVTCLPVSINTWRKVGKALGVPSNKSDKPEEGTA